MPNIGVGLRPETLVLTRGRDFRWQFECTDDSQPPEPVDFPNGELYFELDTGGQANAVQQIEQTAASGGTYTLEFNGSTTDPLNYDAVVQSPEDATPDITSALEALPSIGAGNVSLTPAQLYPVWEITLTLNHGADELQQLVFNNTTGGNFKLGYGFAYTPVIAYNAAPSVVQTALEGLSAIGAGNIEVTPIVNGYQFEFKGSLADTDVGQIVVSTNGIDLSQPFFIYGLTNSNGGVFAGNGLGSLFPTAKISTVLNGSAKWSDTMVNTLNNAVNNFFNSFDSLLGVDINYEVLDTLNTKLTVTSLVAFTENTLLTFSVDITDDLIETALNSVAQFIGIFDTIHVDFYWNRFFQVEFVGDLALNAQPTITAGIGSLTGINDEQAVITTVVNPGKNRYTNWFFSIDSNFATIEVQSDVADTILPRTPFQLVFLPEGETAGGEALALGRVSVQSGNRAVGPSFGCSQLRLLDWS